jgi:hypothetical protein
MEAAGIITQWWWADSRCGDGLSLAQGGQGFLKQGIGQRNGNTFSLSSIVDGRSGDIDAFLSQEQGVRGELCGIVFFGSKIAIFIATGGTAFVVEQHATVSCVFDEIDHASETKLFGMDGYGAQRSSLSDVEVLFAKVRGVINTFVDGGAGGGIRIFYEQILYPLKVK